MSWAVTCKARNARQQQFARGDGPRAAAVRPMPVRSYQVLNRIIQEEYAGSAMSAVVDGAFNAEEYMLLEALNETVLIQPLFSGKQSKP